ncbi:hypothetical protein DMN91_007454 [Ooceraea biroi]|uniref:Fatty acyl-CoA reductase n=1 Tax=Ooceraea biroi TaxID=2015173 RepID=A0A3L8DK87_OOCBI|nr:putative fatty acyl-CoA reductase CG8306 [Ooceraea biroi]RLU20840.1 hypothetical protein DMN91_007454 [Ooceraea biroi]
MTKDAANIYISAFYAGRSIFITGATGFVGKVLIEKLLRSCPNVGEIYMLMRPKKGLDVNERLKKMLENKLFDHLRSEQPSSFDKLIPIIGDVSAEGLGLQLIDRQTLIEKVSVVINVAASVRFDENLKSAIFNNTRSTRDVCILAQDMKKLVALIHISSTYTQTDKVVVNEELYPYDVDWKQMIKIAETVDDDILNTFTAKCLGSFPNTYIFSKRLAEDIISDYSKSLPCAIVRPSIVISTADEPVKGWIDNFNGPVGSFVGGGKGILRVLYMDPLVDSDYMPVDVFIKTVIILTWKRGIKSITEDNTVHVYNCSSYNVINITGIELIQMGFEITKDIPLEGIIWTPRTTVTTNYLKYYTLVILLHILPALVIDAILKLLHKRPMLLKLQRKVFITNNALSYFLLHTWHFRNEKLVQLFDDLSIDNWKDFGYDYGSIVSHRFFVNSLIGAKIFLLNEDMNLDAAKLHRKRMDWLDRIVRILFVFIILWILYRRNTLSYITEALSPFFA